eukprot:Amastigsp_a175842_25.p3 type:complete len:106 gc:universal Amastigsp_a175842_25:518-201(-)
MRARCFRCKPRDPPSPKRRGMVPRGRPRARGQGQGPDRGPAIGPATGRRPTGAPASTTTRGDGDIARDRTVTAKKRKSTRARARNRKRPKGPCVSSRAQRKVRRL